MRKILSALLLLCALLLCACGARSEEPYSLTLWYVEDDPLAPALLRLTESYNREREPDSLAVTARAWTSEELLLGALGSGARPGLVLCSHGLAFSLYEQELLCDAGAAALSYPAWLQDRSACVGHGFYPIGSAVDLLCVRGASPAGLDELLERAAPAGPGNTEPFLTVGRFAPLFYQVLLDAGTEFSAIPQRDALSQDYVNLYNTLAALVFDHVLRLSDIDEVPCRIDSGPALRGRDLSGCALCPLSDGPLLAECRGIAVTARDARMPREAPVFLRWLAASGRMGNAALAAGLIPAAEEELPSDSVLGAALLSLRGRDLHLPDAGCSYYVNQSAFEEEFRAALELLS